MQKSNLDLIKELKINSFTDEYSYYIGLHKIDKIRLEDLIRLKQFSNIEEKDIYKISLFYSNQEQVDNMIILLQNDLENNLLYDIAKNFDRPKIEKFIELININRRFISNDFEFINPEDYKKNNEVIEMEINDDKYYNIYYVYYQAIQNLNQKQIDLMKEMLELEMCPQISYMIATYFSNDTSKKYVF